MIWSNRSCPFAFFWHTHTHTLQKAKHESGVWHWLQSVQQVFVELLQPACISCKHLHGCVMTPSWRTIRRLKKTRRYSNKQSTNVWQGLRYLITNQGALKRKKCKENQSQTETLNWLYAHSSALSMKFFVFYDSRLSFMWLYTIRSSEAKLRARQLLLLAWLFI